MHPEVPINMARLKKKLSGMKAFDVKVKKTVVRNSVANAKWKRDVLSIKPGVHPADKVLIKLSKEAHGKVNSLNSLLIFCDTKLKETHSPFSRALVELRLRVLLKNNLIEDVRQGQNKKVKRATIDPNTPIKESPFFKVWKVQGNQALVSEYRKQRTIGNTQAMKEIERVMIEVNPNKSVDKVQAMLSK